MQPTTSGRNFLRAICCVSFLAISTILTLSSAAQTSFDVATIRPSSSEVKFERNGETKFAYGTLSMHDVTVSTCIQVAYGLSPSLISGPSTLEKTHYDVIAKADPATTSEQMHLMLRALLKERFNLAFHMEKKELKVYSLVVAKAGIKMHPSAPGLESHHQNSAMSMVGYSMTMQELATYLSDPLGAPLTDKTGLPGRYDFTINFMPYVDMGPNDIRPDPVAVLKAALKGELGLEIEQGKDTVDVMIVDHVDPPTPN